MAKRSPEMEAIGSYRPDFLRLMVEHRKRATAAKAERDAALLKKQDEEQAPEADPVDDGGMDVDGLPSGA